MTIPCTIEARPPLFSSDPVVATNLGHLQRDMPLNVQEETGAGAEKSSQVCAPAPEAFEQASLPATVILVSNDFHLSRSREPLLRAAGFQVSVVSSDEFEACELSGSQLVVFFCQSISPEQVSRFLKLMAQHSTHARTVRLTANPQMETEDFDNIFQAPLAPGVLLCEMSKLRTALASEENRDPLPLIPPETATASN